MKNQDVKTDGVYLLDGQRVRVVEKLNIASNTGVVSMRRAQEPGRAFPGTTDEDWKVEVNFIGTDRNEVVKVGRLVAVPD